jgi:hypothetical protein
MELLVTEPFQVVFCRFLCEFDADIAPPSFLL